MMRMVATVGFAALLTIGAVAGWKLAESRLAVDVYRDRLRQMSRDYDLLRSMYNQAVRRTAVTELLVEDEQLSVVIRTADGERRTIDTPYNPNREIYCDYVLVDGRLWIRRVYDANTPPSQGKVINPEFAEVDWDEPGARYGNAVYRSLSDGRWIITVTGDGSLGLVRGQTDTSTDLSPPPEVRDYEQIEQQIDAKLDEVSTLDVLKHTFD